MLQEIITNLYNKIWGIRDEPYLYIESIGIELNLMNP